MSETTNTQEENVYSADKLMDHEYDGIQEYDNRLPNWWLWIFYGSIIFSFIYWLFFHTFSIGKLQVARYDAEMIAATEAQLAKSGGVVTDESLVLVGGIPARLDAGKQIYNQYCVVCHAVNGEGLVGPNLTDAYWIHGNKPTEIHKVITEGVLAKGMAAWGNQLGPQRVESVTAHVLTLKGKNLPGKAPEGDLIED